jgi:lipid-binding SYLF domain-containing protein
MKRIYRQFFFFVVLGLLISCAGPKGDTTAEKKAYIDNMHNQTLSELYKERPEAKERMSKMAGYAVFSSINTNLFLLSSASGYGVAHGGGKKIYMKMYSLGVGPGLGLKDFRAVFMFRNMETFNQFVEKGWEFGGYADAAAKSEEKGGAVGGQASLDSDIVIYTLTESGIALQATLAGTKYWKDDELNR